MNDIIELVHTQNYTALFDLYQSQHWNAWFDLDYGGNPEGIFTAACPPEALHSLENGIIFHILKELFSVIMDTNSCGLLDSHCSSWNNYPGQHNMKSHSVDGYP